MNADTDIRIECPTANSLASLSEHLDVAGIALAESVHVVRTHHPGLNVLQIHCVVTLLPDGRYHPRVNVIRKQ